MRKRRTREHVIADLSVNHVERSVLRVGHVAERVVFDYGYDLFIVTFDGGGEVEPGFLFVQIKATDSPQYVANNREVALVVERRDVGAWLAETVPVFLILYDAPGDVAYWMHVQNEISSFGSGEQSRTITVRFSCEQVLNEAAIRYWHQVKQEAISRERREYD